MRQKGKFLKYLIWFFILAVGMFSTSYAAQMTDYCASPPFIERAITPNLLLTIDNSASMWDLQYVDTGQKACSNGGTCTKDSDCASGGTCSVVTRNATYCYDETYNSAKNYFGYFNLIDPVTSLTQYYQYDFTNNYLSPTTSFPAGSASCGAHAATIFRANTLCIDIDDNTPHQVHSFIASGNYMNWLTSSKFDAEKSILTGGKYCIGACSKTYTTCCLTNTDCPVDPLTGSNEACVALTTPYLQAETRGCVGRKFLKQPLSADFTNYSQCPAGTPGQIPTDCDPNLSNKLNAVLGIRGPVPLDDPTAVSQGGQAYIDIFYGQYNSAMCQQAINDYLNPNVQKSDFITDISNCIGYSATNQKTCQLLQSLTCNSDVPDCILGGGTCSVAEGVCSVIPDGNCNNLLGSCGMSSGSCGALSGGACGLLAGASCAQNNGTCVNIAGKLCYGGTRAGQTCSTNSECPSGTCTGRACSGGGKAGAPCLSSNGDNDCRISQCVNSGSRTGTTCTSDSQCTVCTNPGILYGNACSSASQCNTGTCSSGKPSTTPCTQDSDCYAGFCTSGKPGTTPCTQNSDCDTVGTCTSGKTGSSCTKASDCNSGVGTCASGKVGNACSSNSDCTPSTGVCGTTTYSCKSNADCNVGPCLPPVTTQIKSTFAQSMHSCYQFKNGTDVGSNELQQVTNTEGCSQMYVQYRICNGGANDGLQCTNNANCQSGVCIGGPDAIRAGSPVLLCNSQYAGACSRSICSGGTKNGASCFSDGDCPGGACWTDVRNVTWDNTCVLNAYREYCGAVQTPPVPDPTNDPSNTSSYQNLPAILSDIGVEGQLGNPLAAVRVDINSGSAPSGVLQDFSSVIRLGAMSFDFNGSATECGVRNDATKTVTGGPAFCSNNKTRTCTADTGCANPGICNPAVPCPYVCSGGSNTGNPCALLATGGTKDCPGGGTCVVASSNIDNLDGAHVLANSYIGNTVPISPNGGHTVAGLINDIDRLQAMAWTPFSEAFYNAIGYYALTSTTVTPLRLNAGDFRMAPVPSQLRCQKNNVLLITDGQSTADLNSTVSSLITSNAGLFPAGMHYDTTANNNCTPYAGGRNMEAVSWLAQNRNIQNISAQTPQSNSQKISTYVVYTGTGSMDDDNCAASSTDLATLADCQPDNLMCKTARYGGGKYYLAQDPVELKNKLKSALLQIATNSASGTAASVLASGEGSGANLVQAIFYPSRLSGSYQVDWTGRLQNFWYYIDPRLGNSTIMEDTDLDKTLRLSQDNAVSFVYDPTSHQTTVTTTSPGGVVTPNVSLDSVNYLWEAGKLLLSRTAGNLNTDAGSRVIYTNANPTRGNCSVTTGTSCSANSDCPVTGGVQESCILTNHTLDAFDTSNAAALSPLLNVNLNGSDTAPNYDQTTRLIKYVRGIDDLNANGKPSQGNSLVSPVYQTDAGDIIDGVRARSRTLTDGSVTNVWKLGDIVNSTPKILSWVPLNTYYDIYNDSTYKEFTSTSSYKSRGLVFAGGNDGMLHAFELGLLGLYDDPDLKATLGKHCSTDASKACSSDSNCAPGSCTTDTNLGQEMWAFIPKNSLPYLKYFADSNYCHIYYIDAQPFIFDGSFTIDSSVNPAPATPPAAEDACDDGHYWNCTRSANSWRTVLIGSMRLGGACKNAGNTCQDCTKTPINNVGYSSYFALDITNPLAPQLLWEFSDPGLGFSTSGPAIVKVVNSNLANKRDKNGRWLAVFGSGPTGWISQNNNMAISSMYLSNVGAWNAQPNTMKLFVVDVATGQLVTTIDTGEQGAFAGSLLSATMDFDQGDLSKPGNYQDDAVYFGFTKGYVYGIDSGITQGNSLGGSANTMRLAAIASTTDDFYKGNFMEMWQQDPVTFQWHYEGVKLITGYNGATQTVTVDSNFPVVPTAGSPLTYYYISKGWTRGGVKRLLTNQDVDPAHWAVSTVIDSHSLSGNSNYNSVMGGAGMGPVTASVKKLQNYSDNSVRLYFGSGRYYYRMSDLLDDPSNLRALYSVTEPCFQSTGSVDPACTTVTSGNIAGNAPTVSNIGEATTGAGIDLTTGLKGWWITLDGCRDINLTSVDCVNASGVANPAAVFKAERVVTEPLAATSGAVLFSTITPTSDPCEYGGRSYLWAVRFDTGGTLVPFGILKGKAIIQRSTGDIEQIDLATAFTTAAGGQRDQRRTTASFGLTGSGGISIIVPPKPLNQILHIKKR